jgi:hypothetical protein
LLIDITYHCQSSNGAVLSDKARVKMLSCLLSQRANPNIRVDDIAYNYSPWTAIIRRAVGVRLAELLPQYHNAIFYDPKNIGLWLQMARRMINYGASTRRRTIIKSIVQQFESTATRMEALSEGQRKEVEEAASKAAKWLLIERGVNPKWNRLKGLFAQRSSSQF